MFGILLGLYVGIYAGTQMMQQQQAIEHHAAQYNATDGSFEWLK